MSGFTKQELEFLRDFLDDAVPMYEEPDITYALRDKFQAMIDNYGENPCWCKFIHVPEWRIEELHSRLQAGEKAVKIIFDR